MARKAKAPRTAALALFGLLTLVIFELGCSTKSGAPGGPGTASQSASLTGPFTVTLSVANPLAPLSPVLLGSNSVELGQGAIVASGTVVGMGSGSFALEAESGALLNDAWSRGLAVIQDRVNVRGVLHASQRTLGSGVTLGGSDTNPTFDPVSSLTWNVVFPSGPANDVSVNPGQVVTLTPGRYGNVEVHDPATLTLATGTYYLTGLTLHSQSTVNLNQANGPVIVYVSNTIILNGSYASLGGGSPDLLIGYLGTNQVIVQSVFSGTILAPSAFLALQPVGLHSGFFAAQDIDLRPGGQVQYRFPAALIAASGASGMQCQQLLGDAGIPPQNIGRYCTLCISPDDTDLDGIPDCADGCPYDSLKSVPGICGCNVSDTDSDGDGVPDCKDRCPNDPNNVIPGQCGCIGQVGLEPAGIPCTDTACPQTGATCNGAGVCGNPAACSPAPGSRLVKDFGVSRWFVGVTFPAQTGPDGGIENITTGAPASEPSAQNACSAKGLTLTRIHTPDENRQIAGFLTAPLWLGANDLQTAGQWRWSLPNSNSGDLFWSGGATGSRQNNLYSNWAAGAPGSASCAAMVPEGHWFDTNCSEQFGYVCEYRSPPPGLPPNFPPIRLPGPQLAVPFPDAGCVNEFDLDGGGLPDSLAELIREVQAARDGSFFGAAAHPPPDGSTCPSEGPDAAASEAIGIVRDSGAGCAFIKEQQIFSPNQGADGGPGMVDCLADNECSDALGPTFVCRQVPDDKSCSPPDASDAATSLAAGHCRGHALCVQLVCPPVTNTCREVRICKPNTDFDAGLDPTSNLDAGMFDPAALFDGGLPDASPSAKYDDPPMFDGAAHTWCHMVPQNQVAPANQPPQNTNGSSGQGSTISFSFDPNLVFNVNANPLALGENGMDIHAAATLTAAVHLSNFLGQNYNADIVDIGAGVRAARCSVTNDETQFVVLGVDVIPLLGLGVPKINTAKLLPQATQDCDDAVANFSLWANRAKKAFRDAQQLVAAYKDITGNGAQLANTLCQDIMSAVSANDVAFFPGGLECPVDEPVEYTINRFVDYLQAPGFGQISQLRQAVGDLTTKSTRVLEKALPKLNAQFLDLKRDESQTILNVPFAIGPVPMVLQIDVFAGYGINGNFVLDLKTPLAQMFGGLDDSSTKQKGPGVTPIEIARIEVDVIPWAAAGPVRVRRCRRRPGRVLGDARD